LTHREAGQLKALHKALEGARSNPLGLWNSRDWASYLLWGILLSPVIVVVVLALLAQQQLQLQEQANALLSNRLQAAQAESTDLRKRVSLQTETIERLERELSAPQEPSPSASGVLGSLRAYQLRVGQHVHFISDEPGGLELTLMEGISSCASCSIAPYANPKWGTYFWSDEPGTYVLRLRNLRSVDARVSVGTHEPPSQDMGPTISTFVMRPLEVRSLRIEVREAVRRAPEVQRIPRLR
jgi:hypothetical protein